MFEFVDRGSVTASFTPCIEDGVVGPYDPPRFVVNGFRGPLRECSHKSRDGCTRGVCKFEIKR